MFDNIVSTEFTFADSHETPEQAVHRAAEKGTSWFGRLAKSDSQTVGGDEALYPAAYMNLWPGQFR